MNTPPKIADAPALRALRLGHLREIGAELAKMPKAKGGKPYQKATGPKEEPVAATLAELGVSRKRASGALRADVAGRMSPAISMKC
jgi:hypothetical protein